MVPVQMLATILWQGDVPSSDAMHWLVIFVGVIAFCSFVQFLVFVGAGIAGLRVYKSVSTEMALLKAKALPIVASVQGVIDDNRPAVKRVTTKIQEIVDDSTPKVKTVTTNVTQASDFVVAKLREYEGTIDEANQTLRDVNSKTRAQVNRVDGMVSTALKATSDVGTTIHRGIRTPVMEVAGMVNGVKAALDVLTGRSKPDLSSARTQGASAARSDFSQSTGASTSGFPGAGRYEAAAARAAAQGPGPVPVAASTREVHPEMDPSSAVAPSPGAEEVVKRFRESEKVKTIY